MTRFIMVGLRTQAAAERAVNKSPPPKYIYVAWIRRRTSGDHPLQHRGHIIRLKKPLSGNGHQIIDTHYNLRYTVL
jgi:hypothetical protein